MSTLDTNLWLLLSFLYESSCQYAAMTPAPAVVMKTGLDLFWAAVRQGACGWV